MTLLEWQICTDPQKMIGFVGGKASERKLRLFAAESCRQVWHLLSDERWRTAVESAERSARGWHHEWVFEHARRCAEAASQEYADFIAQGSERAIQALQKEEKEGVLLELAISSLFRQEDWGLACARDAASACITPQAQAKRADLLRDLFGPDPLHPIHLDLFNLRHKAVHLAFSISSGRQFHLFPELGEALKYRGCHDPRVIEHCLDGRDHTAGCWVIDAIFSRK